LKESWAKNSRFACRVRFEKGGAERGSKIKKDQNAWRRVERGKKKHTVRVTGEVHGGTKAVDGAEPTARSPDAPSPSIINQKEKKYRGGGAKTQGTTEG